MTFIQKCSASAARVAGAVKGRLWRQKRYFKDNSRSITQSNLSMLVYASVVCIVLLLALILLSPLIIKGWRVSVYHLLMFITFTAFLAFAVWYRTVQKQPDSAVVNLACRLFCVALTVHLVSVSIFPYPDEPEALASLCFMAVPIIFTLPFSFTATLSVLGEAAFIVLSVKFKSDAAMQHDVFSTLAAVLFSLVLSMRVLRLRMQDYSAIARYKSKSRTDQLTGILNKSAFQNACAAELHANSRRDTCALFVIDVDDFKSVNDSYGHKAGDDILELMGEALLNTFRGSDLLGRFGGDEFCVLMRGIDAVSDDAAKKAVQKAVQLQKHLRTASEQLVSEQVTCSIGIALSCQSFCTLQQLFELADSALYTSKQHGKNCATVKKLTAG